MEYQAEFPAWLARMIELHVVYAVKQSISLVKIAWYDVQIFWCDVKIFWYS